jgi:pyruvate carboxylase
VEALRNTPYETDFNIDSLNAFSNYWENVREYYYPFESGLQAGTAEVYKHEIPGGQYSNLKPQAVSMGLADRMDDIKKAYEEVNELFGDIVKVTPSSKVVGDLAMFMVTQGLTKKDILEKGDQLSFPESVKSMMRGDLGQPLGGWPEALQRMVLKDEQPYTDLPNAHMQPVDFEQAFADFRKKFGSQLPFTDFLSYGFYPKVFEAFHAFRQEFGDISPLPTTAFFYGLKPNEEILVNLGQGKTLLIRLLYVGSYIDDEGKRSVYFRLNGQTRQIEVVDRKAVVHKVQHRKAAGDKDIGSPLQGKLSKIFVREGDTVARNQPLFTIEAMKMESTVVANEDGKIAGVTLKEGTMVEADDLVLELQ